MGDRQQLADTTLPATRRKAAARRVEGFRRAAVGALSDFYLLRDLQGIVDLDAEVPDCRFQPMSRSTYARLSPVPDYVPKHMQTPLAGQAHALRGT